MFSGWYTEQWDESTVTMYDVTCVEPIAEHHFPLMSAQPLQCFQMQKRKLCDNFLSSIVPGLLQKKKKGKHLEAVLALKSAQIVIRSSPADKFYCFLKGF